MASLGTGILPSGATGVELTAVTRRAFVPKLVVQLYNSSPTLAMLIGNSQPAVGGVNSVSIPVQGTAYVVGQWSDYSGTFNQPSTLNGTSLAEYSLKLMIVPIPFLGTEGLVQLDHTIIPLIEARMNDGTNVMADLMSTALFNNTSNNQQFIGFPGAIDDSTNLNVYGNVNRTNNVFWKSKVYAAGNVNPTRQSLLQYIAGTVKNGAEMPNFGVTGFGTWALLAQDYQGQETYMITPGSAFSDSESSEPRSAFKALMVAGVPIYADPYALEGIVYLVNTNYINLYIHEQASFAFTGFESTLPNFQLGYVGALVTVAELVCVKPKACTRIGGYNSLTI